MSTTSTTTIKNRTLRQVLNNALPDNTPDALRKIKFGNMLSVVKVTVTGLTSSATVDITSAAVKAAATYTGVELVSGEGLPPIAVAGALRTTAGTGNVGAYVVADVGATALAPATANGVAGVATLSNDGKTLVFPAAVTAFVISYIPRAAVSPDTIFEPTT